MGSVVCALAAVAVSRPPAAAVMMLRRDIVSMTRFSVPTNMVA
jgi:hypothetical protein